MLKRLTYIQIEEERTSLLGVGISILLSANSLYFEHLWGVRLNSING